MSLALYKLVQDGVIPEMPLVNCVSAVSAGIVNDELLLDLCYEEDSAAQVDLNCVMTGDGRLVELQATGEGRPFTVEEQQALVELCRKYGVKLYVEDEAFLTDLFPLSLNQGKYNALFYQEDSALQEYLALKGEKKAALAQGTYGQARRDIAWRFGKLLSYTDEGIRWLLESNTEKE